MGANLQDPASTGERLYRAHQASLHFGDLRIGTVCALLYIGVS